MTTPTTPYERLIVALEDRPGIIPESLRADITAVLTRVRQAETETDVPSRIGPSLYETWYRAYTPDGRLWTESMDVADFRRQCLLAAQPLAYQRFSIYQFGVAEELADLP